MIAKRRGQCIATTVCAAGLAVLTAWATPATADPILTVSSGPSLQQVDNRPCIIGDPSCHNPESLPYTLIPAGKKGASGTLSSASYTVDQIRDLVGGNTFMVGVDLNQAMGHNDGAYTLQSFTLKVDGVTMYSTTGATTLYPLNPGNGYSDASIAQFDLTGLSGSQTLVFTTTFSGATAGREQYFLMSTAAAPPGGGSTAPIPEPATLILLGAGMAGAAALRRRTAR